MSDKPSAQPPSIFVRDLSNHSLAQSLNVDYLMDQYHHGSSRPSVDFQPAMRTTATLDDIQHASADPKESGFFRFGRMVASSFNPVNAWGTFSRTWKETKEDMTVRNIEENRRKAAQKALAEQKYAELKKSGLLSKPAYTVMSNEICGLDREDDDDETNLPIKEEDIEHQARDIPRDSAITVQGDSWDAPKSLPHLPQLQVSGPPDSPAVQQQPEKPLKLRKSFFTIRRPSLNNLKRVRSELNLGAFPGRQSSSSSLSPEKQDIADSGTLLKSQSRRDLKAQHRLNKRVSDLESKLVDARRDLQNTISGVSPVTLTSRFEKFTPSHRGRPRFIPSKLPSLPSERLLFPQEHSNQIVTQQDDDVFTPTNPTNSLKHSLVLDPINKILPVVPEPEIDSHGLDQDVDQTHEPYFPITSIHQASAGFIDQDNDMDPTTLFSAPTEDVGAPAEYQDLDTRLKALDANVKMNTKRKFGIKKRKSSSNDDALYRPGRGEGDDSDYSDTSKTKATKKRKSGGKVTEAAEFKKGTKSSNFVAKAKKSVNTVETAPAVEPLKPLAPAIRVEAVVSNEIIEIPSDNENDDVDENIAATDPEPELCTTRTSIDSQTGPLEPIYEEDTIAVATKHDSGVSMTSTHSVHVRNTSRTRSALLFETKARSSSPNKALSATTITTSTTRLNRGRSNSPPPLATHSSVIEAVDDLVTATPGVSKAKADWDWPDDVF